jgi:hypothetical protein
MSSVFDFFNTLLIGAMTATIYFLNKEIAAIHERLDTLEDEDVFLNESEDEDETEPEETKKEE